MLFWGPPGVGKTTLARVIAGQFDAQFVPLSAVKAGVKDIREVATLASSYEGTTLLFLDEVHRFNKSQQDILLPFVEDGTLVLIGATTENPSFEVNGALRSRTQLYVLKALTTDDIKQVLERALTSDKGFAGELDVEPDALEVVAQWADGDARRALGALELASSFAKDGYLSAKATKDALSVKGLAFDKGGEHFYNLISALHKSVRASQVDAALYWLARLLGGGADPRYVSRRLVRMASEDIGLADPNALRLAVAAKDAVDFLGLPEGELALAQATVYLAAAPKSNAVYTAWASAQKAAQQFSSAEVPMHLRNASTSLMKGLGYGHSYAYYFDDPEGSFAQTYFPETMPDALYFKAGDEGWERKLNERLKTLQEAKKTARTKKPNKA